VSRFSSLVRGLPELKASEAGSLPTVLALPVLSAREGDADNRLPLTALPLPDELLAELATFIDEVEHSGRAGSVHTLRHAGSFPVTVHVFGASSVAGSQPEATTESTWRAAGAAIARAASSVPAVSVALPSELSHEAIRGLAEGLLLASYRFSLATDAAKKPRLRRVTLLTDRPAEFAEPLGRAGVLAEATCFARDLVNMPSMTKSPEWFADQVVRAAETRSVTSKVRGPAQLVAEGFGGILAVGGGSSRGPRLVELSWSPRGAKAHVVLIGKGITFDTGGISIKPAPGMQLMKKDMGGGAAVVGAVLAAAALKLPVKVTVLVPMAENLPSGSAYRPGDVVRHYGGKTSEILNTDAEGRVVLADVLSYVDGFPPRRRPDAVVELATLTGAQSVALGKKTAALLTDNDELAVAVTTAAETAGEKVWRLPLAEDYSPELESSIADLNNAAGNPGTITAALYLREFAGHNADRWLHLDMSGPAWSDKPDGELVKGGTGWGVRTLVRWLENLIE
jgi:leucyl aminopeptidase